jgi:hypothetical protein
MAANIAVVNSTDMAIEVMLAERKNHTTGAR